MLKETETKETKVFFVSFLSLVASGRSQKPMVSKHVFDDVMVLQ